MTEPKFTPGPWKQKDDKILAPAITWQNHTGMLWEGIPYICQIMYPTASKTETANSNARLIAAAPEMYELLQETFGDECDDDCGSACDIAEECEVRRARILIAQINREEKNHE